MNQPQRTNPKFKAGDVVMIRGRSPHMTVERIRPTNPSIIECVWFDTKQRVQRDAFDDFILTLVSGN